MKVLGFIRRCNSLYLLLIAESLALVILTSCSPNGALQTPQPPPVYSPAPTCTNGCPQTPADQRSQVAPTPDSHLLPACASNDYVAPIGVIANGKRMDVVWGKNADRFATQRGWLSIHLELTRDKIQFTEPVPLRLIYTNTTDHPVVFVRPQIISFLGDDSLAGPNVSSGILVDLISVTGKRVKPLPEMFTRFNYTPPPAEEFSLLPPRQSCSVELSLIWDETILPLGEPISPGDYRMTIVSRHYDLGPQLENNSDKMLDIGAWVGRTEPSNEVTFTVLSEK